MVGEAAGDRLGLFVLRDHIGRGIADEFDVAFEALVRLANDDLAFLVVGVAPPVGPAFGVVDIQVPWNQIFCFDALARGPVSFGIAPLLGLDRVEVV